jgi:hypothetical protein
MAAGVGAKLSASPGYWHRSLSPGNTEARNPYYRGVACNPYLRLPFFTRTMSIRPVLLCSCATAVAAFTSCSTDLDVAAPYKENTVVYALLDKGTTIQFVKINKAFLGPGNALVYASPSPIPAEYTGRAVTGPSAGGEERRRGQRPPICFRTPCMDHDPGDLRRSAAQAVLLQCGQLGFHAPPTGLDATAKGKHRERGNQHRGADGTHGGHRQPAAAAGAHGVATATPT